MTDPLHAWSAPHPDAVIEVQKTNWLLTTLAGLGAGLVAAALYALISVTTKTEFLMLIVGVGIVIGVVVMAMAKVDTIATGLLSLAIAAVSLAVAIYLFETSLMWGSFGKALSHIGQADADVAFETYFGDPLGWVWVLASLAVAFYVGSGMGKKASSPPQASPIDATAGDQAPEA